MFILTHIKQTPITNKPIIAASHLKKKLYIVNINKQTKKKVKTEIAIFLFFQS